MKISKMLLHYGLMFTVPTAVAFFYWDPKSDDDIRKEVVRTYTSVTPLCALAHWPSSRMRQSASCCPALLITDV